MAPKSFEVRLLREQDNVENFFEECKDIVSGEFREDLSASIRRNFVPKTDVRVFAALDNNKIVGLGSVRIYDKDKAGLRQVLVHPSFKGSAVRKELVDARVEWSKNNGVTSVEVDIGDNFDKAIAAYSKQGFTPKKPLSAYGVRPEIITLVKKING